MPKSLTSKEGKLLLKEGHLVTSCKSELQFADLANSLGQIIPSRKNGPLKDILEVLNNEEATTRSLSSHFGRGYFPLHTDLAHSPIPPRYVLLRSAGKVNSRKTLVIDVGETALSPSWTTSLENDIWYINGGRGGFLSPIRNTSILKGRTIFRYNEQIMRPADRIDVDSLATIQKVKATLPLKEYVLQSGECLVIDNWRTIHGRGAEPPISDKDTRRLERYLVNETI